MPVIAIRNDNTNGNDNEMSDRTTANDGDTALFINSGDADDDSLRRMMIARLFSNENHPRMKKLLVRYMRHFNK